MISSCKSGIKSKFTAAGIRVGNQVGVGRLYADAGQAPQLAGKGADDILRRIYRDTDNIYIPFVIRNTHAADNVGTVGMQNRVEFGNGALVFYNNAD